MASDKQHSPFSWSSSFQEGSLQGRVDDKSTLEEGDYPLKSQIKQEGTTWDSTVEYYPNYESSRIDCKTFDKISNDVKREYENVDPSLRIKTEEVDLPNLPDKREFKNDDRHVPGYTFKGENRLQDTELKNESSNEHDGSTSITNHWDYSAESILNLINPSKHSHDVSAKGLKSNRSTRIKLNLNLNTELIFKQYESSDEVFKCSHCDFTTRYKICLTQHTSSNHTVSTRMYKCNQCDFQAKWQHVLTTHLKLKHEGTTEVFKCNHCEYTTKWRHGLDTHIKVKHDESAKIFTCNHCNYSTKRRGDLNKHIKITHDISAAVFKCNECEYDTKIRSHLSRHYKCWHDDSS